MREALQGSGSGLSSQGVTPQVLSLLTRFTAVFGMGTGGSTSPCHQNFLNTSHFRGQHPDDCIEIRIKESIRKPIRLSPRPISTARLHALLRFHLPPINPVFFRGSYLVVPVGELILGWASHLDAFSAYPLPTQLPGMYRWRDNPYTGGRSVSVLSY